MAAPLAARAVRLFGSAGFGQPPSLHRCGMSGPDGQRHETGRESRRESVGEKESKRVGREGGRER